MSHLLRRTKKSCLKLLRKISTSRQLFVQRLDEEDGDEEDEMEPSDGEAYLQKDVNSNCHTAEAIYEELQLNECSPKPDQHQHQHQQHQHQTQPQAVQHFEYASEAEEEKQPQPQLHYPETKLDLRSRYLLSSSNYEVLESTPVPDSGIEFERVPYRENVRYLRHTPSNSSLDLHLQVEEQQKQQQQQPQPKPKPQQPQQMPTVARFHPCSFSLGSKIEGNYHNVVIMEPPHDDYPIVKWDINGNSMDDESIDRWQLSTHWDDFDSRWRKAATGPSHFRSRSQSQSQSQSQRSSHQSSSCTLETWIDEAEPLSLGPFVDENPQVNAGTHSSLCLKSF
ncbi:RNA polymerase II degradation factor 1 [Drosophila subobscura]|uniref:RNA polymerase II degradation factor 1 n=1 Tax=Drosophila subobscura TaxID=7241 RepID=UPI00155AB4CC|nr:RNA polymerase II degradation factor 1 [Drosophila subobscura]